MSCSRLPRGSSTSAAGFCVHQPRLIGQDRVQQPDVVEDARGRLAFLAFADDEVFDQLNRDRLQRQLVA
jgi:hypothetical protein